MGLKLYKAKRNFRRTREPGGRVHSRRVSSGRQLFVVQKHAATRLHYDFRLEMEGVLKSWAVPKGFPTRRGDRRLAIEVEDHPIEYANFEGTIPEGSYGAGTVMVWDTGDYEVLGGSPPEALRQGKLHLQLHGNKLRGEWTLVRMRSRQQTNKPQWLLLKSGEDLPDFSARNENRSVLSRRSMEEIASANGPEWESDRPARQTRVLRRPPAAPFRRVQPSPKSSRMGKKLDLEHLPPKKSGFVEPMKALLTGHLPRGSEWVYEVKFDGVRAIAVKRGKEVELWSRNAKPLNGKYPEVAEGLKELSAREAVLDGEIVAVDAEGRPSFQLLQTYQLPGGKKPPLFYYVFDVLQFEGKDTTSLPLVERKKLAGSMFQELPPIIRFSGVLEGDLDVVLEQMKRRGLEGVIAKRKVSKYEAGRRSGAWLKFKWTNEQEFVIGGYSRPQGARAYFGALLVGYYEKDKLIFAAKVGTGFSHKLLGALYKRFQKLIKTDCPFANLPERNARHGGLSRAEMQRCTWLEPELVCQIRFAEWTSDKHLRQPAFVGLREDKNPREVVRE